MAWPAQLQPLSPSAPHGSPRRLLSRRKSIVLLATACLLAAVLIYEGIAFGRRLEEQRVAEEMKRQTQAIFQQLEDDLAPFPQISQEMVEQAYCSCRRSGFRFQVVKGQMYVAGEIAPWQSRHEYIKHQLLELARVDSQLPDVDMYFASTDFPEYCDITEGPQACRQRGVHIQHTKSREDQHIILHPDETFGGWPESKIGPWEQMQQVLSLSAAENVWESREPALFFSGANLGFPRRNLSLTDWSEVKEGCPRMDVRWVNWGDASTVLPLHDFCKWRHLLHVAGCSWSSRLKYLMLCKSAIVFPSSPWQEFWYPALRPGVNFVQVDDVNGTNKGLHLVDAVRKLQRSPRTARRLAAAAQATAMRVLTTENLREYWRRLLYAYAKRQTFRPQKHEDAVPLHVSLKHPVHLTPETRTCLICPHPSWRNYNGSFCRGVEDP